MLLGALLDDLFDDLEELIDEAENAGKAILMQAGMEAQRVIENARIVYRELLEETIEKLDQLIQDTIGQIQIMVTQVLEEAFDNLDELTERAQIITNTLPFADEDPQVMRTAPHFIVPSRQGDLVEIAYSGNFPRAAEDEFEPRLLDADDNEYRIVENTTLALRFEVPKQTILDTSRPFGGTRKDAATTVRLVMRTPRVEATFKTKIGILPDRPGDITLAVTERIRQGESQFNRHRYQQYSTTENIDKTYEQAVSSPGDGEAWRVQPGTFSIYPNKPATATGAQTLPGGKNEGLWGWELLNDQLPDRVIWRVETKYVAIADQMSGKIDFQVDFIEERMKWVEVKHPESHIDLPWGDSRVLFENVPYKFRVEFDGFDGSHQVYTGIVVDKFLRIEPQGGQYRIVAADPATLKWP